MIKKSFMEKIDDETLAKMIDKTLNYEKNQKATKTKSILFKIIPAVAAIALVIGLAMGFPNIIGNTPVAPAAESRQIESSELYLPQFIEQSFFEEKILAAVESEKDQITLKSYYAPRDLSTYSTENTADGIITTYSFDVNVVTDKVYRLDPTVSERESGVLFEILLGIDFTVDDLEYMYRDFDDLFSAYINYGATISERPEPYAHVRFGETRDILLLEVEWHTPETLAEWYEKSISEVPDDYKFQNSDGQIFDKGGLIKNWEEYHELVENGELYVSRYINGKESQVTFNLSALEDYCFDSEGYFIYNIYPYFPSVSYCDENCIVKTISFEVAYSKQEYESILQNEIIPFCNDLLAKGLMPQENYDFYTILNPLDYYVDEWFN